MLETVVTVVLSFSLLLWLRVMPCDQLRHPLSPLNIYAPLLPPSSLLSFLSLLFFSLFN